MLSQSKIKLIRSLRLSKFRNMHGLFVVEGDKIVCELLSQPSLMPLKITNIFALGDWVEKHGQETGPYKDMIDIVSPRELVRISSLKTPNKALALVELPKNEWSLPDPESKLVVALEDIQDPGNMGTIIRLADWFSIGDLVLSPGCADPFSPKVVQASMGSVFRVKTCHTDLEAWMKSLNKNIPLYGTLMEGRSIYNTGLSTRCGVLLFGNESQGISDELQKLLSKPITIPRGTGQRQGPDSLNVAMAAAIVLSEFTRQSS